MSIDIYYNTDYLSALLEWNQLEDCYKEQIKSKTTVYLPKTSGMVLDKKSGQNRYDAYLRRSNYYNHIKQTVSNSKNAIGRKPATIENLPENMEYLKENFNSDGESLFSVLGDIYTEQMKLGRVGYLVDVITDNKTFEVVRYKAQSILDWSFRRVDGVKTLEYVLLNEDIETINAQGKTEQSIIQRVLGLDYQNKYFTATFDKDESESIGDLKLNMNIENGLSSFEDKIISPDFSGRQLNYIPFRVVNVDNLKMDIQQPPLLNQSNLSIGVYNADANHQALVYLQTANMLFMTGVSESQFKNGFIGVDGVFYTDSTEAKAAYIGVSGEGLLESRENLNELKIETGSFGVTVMEKNTQESEKSLQSRIQLQTDKLRDVSLSGAKLVQFLLNTISLWMGGKGDIIVTGNTDFRTEQEKADELEKIYTVWSQNGMTNTDYWKWQTKNLYTDLEFKEWELELNRKVNNDIDKTVNDDQ